MLVSTGKVSNISFNTADASGQVIDLGDGPTEHGYCYTKTPDVMVACSKTKLDILAGAGGFTSQLTNLEPGTKYCIIP